ncbi:hypothetical protein RGQ29_002151 [Quercus rubra]|uniref:Uncharacterized protein n=1 Tax=Quercus rubra TaxID=3512 RepID=A0AAN7JF72_QUERU|nr:hypothetical protein RGQ29_002151 [Quercus rubra]
MKDRVVFQQLHIICYSFFSSGWRTNLAQFISSNLIGKAAKASALGQDGDEYDLIKTI